MNINTATFDELRTLTNVGQSRARYIIKKRDECNGCLSMETLLDISQIPNSVWNENEGKFYFGESVTCEASDDEDGPTNTTTNMEKDIRGDLSKLFHCMEKLQMTVGTVNDKLENLTDRVEALEQKEPSPYGASPVTIPSTSVLSKGYVDKHVYHPYKDSHMPGGPSIGKEEKAKYVSQNYGPPASKLPTFDGTKNWNTFIFQFERVAKRYGWEEEEKLNRLGESFLDDALDYFSSLSEYMRGDFLRLKDKMTSAFGQKDSQAVVRRKIQDLKQGQEESIEEYSRRTWKLATGAYCNFKEDDIEILAVDAFLKGCKDKSAALVAMNQEPKTLDQALHAVIVSTQNHRIIHGQKPQIRQVQFMEPEKKGTDMDSFKEVMERQFSLLQKIAEKLDVKKSAKYPSSPPASPSKNECFQCGKVGHFANKCPQRSRSPSPGGRACYSCGKYGHFEKDCMNQSKRSYRSESPRPNTRSRSPKRDLNSH